MKRNASRISGLLLAAGLLMSCTSTDVAPGDSAATSVVDGSFRESAAVQVDSSGVRTLTATVTVENLTGTPAPLQWSEDCALNGPVRLRVFRGTEVIWDSQRYLPFQGCPATLINSFVDPHGSAAYGYRIPVGKILGDSLAPGDYTLSVEPTFVSPVSTKEVPAGHLTLADPVAVPPGTNLDGQWSGSSGDLMMSFTLAWTADSVHGTGTFKLTGASDAQCVEPELQGSGAVGFVAARDGDVVGGYLVFGTAYGPPYSGRLTSATRFEGKTMNVDTPGCPITLTRGP